MAGTGDFFDRAADEFLCDIDIIQKRAFQAMTEEANTPGRVEGTIAVDTGNLRGTITVNGVEGASQWQGAVALTPKNGELFVEWTAPYAIHVEEGANGVPARLFAERAAQRWGRRVEQEVARVR